MGDSVFGISNLNTLVDVRSTAFAMFFGAGRATTATATTTTTTATRGASRSSFCNASAYSSSRALAREVDSESELFPRLCLASRSLSPTTARTDMDSRATALRRSVLSLIEEHPELNMSIDMVDRHVERAAALVRAFQQRCIHEVMKRLKAAQNLYLAFVVDTTGSMASHIAGVKDQIRTIVHMIAKQDVHIHVAFVGYKDHSDGSNHFEVLPFTKDTGVFRTFLDSVGATGGADEAEDVLGGLKQALTQLSWNQDATNLIFHIADAPPHGRQYQNAGGAGDSFPCGHSSDPSTEDLFGMMRARDVQYFFGKINGTTDTMISVFNTHAPAPITSFRVADSDSIADSVVSASSTSLTAKREKSMSLLRSSAKAKMKLFTYRTLEPTWDAVPPLSGALVSYALPRSIQHLVRGDFQRSTRKATFKIAPQPFAHGAERAAFYALECHRVSTSDDAAVRVTTRHPPPPPPPHPVDPSCRRRVTRTLPMTTEKMVLKTYLREGSGTEAEGNRFMNAIETQSVAAFLAQKFNQLVKHATGTTEPQLTFLKAKVLRIGRSAPYEFYSVEKRYRDYDSTPFVKLSNNAGHISTVDHEYVEYALAYSHWTWHCTTGYLMVVDLQGQRLEGDKLVLTDPAIHSSDPIRFNSSTNLGVKGFGRFFKTHRCNKFCRLLGLNRSAEAQLAEWNAS